MGQVTLRVFNDYATQLLPHFNLQTTTVNTRIGSGRATYCRRYAKHYCITYGRGMILDKLDPNLCVGWLTGREISERHYFDAEINYLNLLSHTICHEFAHVVQFEYAPKTRKAAKVHDKVFYYLLDEIHEQGYGQAVKDDLSEHARRYQLPLQFTQAPSTLFANRQLTTGKIVAFEHGGNKYQGQIKRRNKPTYTVEVHSPNGLQKWRVPHHAVQA